MTFKTLSDIIKKHREQPTQLARLQEQGIVQAQAIINALRANHYKAYHEREANWEQDHPGKEFYQRTEEDNRRDCRLHEWYWDFFQRIHAAKSPEIRYELERNPAHGLGHKSKLHGLDDQCIKFGNKIGKTAKQNNELCKSYLKPIIDDFVYHWNEKHQDITLKKKEEKNTAKLNTIVN